jgi:hypothetical protein
MGNGLLMLEILIWIDGKKVKTHKKCERECCKKRGDVNRNKGIEWENRGDSQANQNQSRETINCSSFWMKSWENCCSCKFIELILKREWEL